MVGFGGLQLRLQSCMEDMRDGINIDIFRNVHMHLAYEFCTSVHDLNAKSVFAMGTMRGMS